MRCVAAPYPTYRVGLTVLATEVATHTCYVNAIAVSREWVGRFGPADIGMMSLLVLNFMWLKFTSIWRVFRLWALASGVEVPENMTRCVNNNFTIEGFWKGWHRSFNRWLVRYLYVPLGGYEWRALNSWVVFFFVALWHEARWRLFGWAIIFALFYLSEQCAQWIGHQMFPTQESRCTREFRLVRSFAAALNVHVPMAGRCKLDPDLKATVFKVRL